MYVCMFDLFCGGAIRPDFPNRRPSFLAVGPSSKLSFSAVVAVTIP